VASLNRPAVAAFCFVAELIPESYVAPLDLPMIFGRTAPLHVDLGCGDGSFLAALAQRAPEKNFLGIEKLAGRIEKAGRKTAMFGNVRVLLAETSYAVRYLLPEASVEEFYLLFPDPWPKRRHQRRRIITSDLLNSIHVALEKAGLLRIATDQPDYFAQIARLGGNDSRFAILDPDNNDLPPTKFERRFQTQGAPIYRLTLRKVSPVI
jgi:tRNA (guanine-N7-)-methyltransferase